MRLVFALKWPSIRYGLQHNTSRDIEELIAFYRVEPYGDEWRQAGQIAAYVAAAGGAKNVRIKDFMPFPQEEQSPDEVFGVFKTLFGF